MFSENSLNVGIDSQNIDLWGGHENLHWFRPKGHYCVQLHGSGLENAKVDQHFAKMAADP